MTTRKGCRPSLLLILALGLLVGPGTRPAAARPDRIVRVLIAADQGFRDDSGWETRARGALETAAAPFRDDFGIRFDVARVVSWTSAGNDYDLAALHDELSREIDPAGADIVIGFTGSERETESRHLVKLGHSDTPGRWVIVTGRAGDDLPIVLRHELGHAFGVPHVRSVVSVMNEDVRAERSRFDPMSASVIGNNVDLEFGNPDPFAGCRLDRLEAIYDGMAESGNDVADLVALVGDSHRRRHEDDAAEREYRRALELDPDLLNARLGLAMMAMTARRYAEAVRLFEDVRREEPEIPGLDMNLGIAYSALGQAVNARSAYDRAIDANPEDAAAMNNLALLCVEDRDYDRAERLFREAVTLRPRFMEAMNNLGMLYDRMDRPEDAIRTFRSALLISENAVTHRNLGTLLLRQGRRTEAREHFEASLRLDPAQAGADEIRAFSRELR